MRFLVGSGIGEPRPDLECFYGKGEYQVPSELKTNRVSAPKAPSLVADGLSSDKVMLKFNSDDWVFSQATAVCSVPVEEDGYTVKPCATHLINDNGNGFSNEVMKKMYKSFIGAYNYVDHNQVPDEARGIILDATLRKVLLDEDTRDYSYYVDVVIATNKNKDTKWADLVRSGKVKFLSMGCESSCLQCSRCGALLFTDEETCPHSAEVGLCYIDENGHKRPTALMVSLAGSEGARGFGYFIELSYLSVDPAFRGAVQGSVVSVPPSTWVGMEIPRVSLKRGSFSEFVDDIYLEGGSSLRSISI